MDVSEECARDDAHCNGQPSVPAFQSLHFVQRHGDAGRALTRAAQSAPAEANDRVADELWSPNILDFAPYPNAR